MAFVSFSEMQRSAFQNTLDNGSEAEYQSLCREFGVHPCYSTGMGRVVLAAEDEANAPIQKAVPNRRLFRVCKRGDDLRCQAGQVLSHLKSRSERRGAAPGLDPDYAAFRRNVKATVLIVDKGGLEIGQPNEKGKIRIKGLESRYGLDLSRYSQNEAHRDLPLCDHYFYANELIPDTDIYGSGFFIDHDKVVTAAHVLNEAFFEKVKPENLLFIRGRYVYETGKMEIDVFADQLYLLNQPTILIRDQIRYGDFDGDLAWVKVRPYFEGRAYPFEWNGIESRPMSVDTDVYGLGHGLGVPMKLSFGGKIQDEIYAGIPAMFTCDMNILPGSSGSPIFDADSHRLVGIVSGLHEIYTEAVPKGNCVELKTNMKGGFSGIATYIAPFRSL